MPITYKTSFAISKMDCNAEEELVRMQLSKFPNIKNLDFYLDKRQVDIIYEGTLDKIEKAIIDLNLGAKLIKNVKYEGSTEFTEGKIAKNALILVLVINLSFFILESITGFIANSMGLVADSLDMLADVIVYGLSLYALNKAAVKKFTIARMSGYFQLILAIFGFIEVVRRFLGFEEVPGFQTMIIVSFLALLGNLASLLILQKSKSKEINVRASWIFTSNDVVVNIGVIIAGVLVYLFDSNIPDLIVGSIIFLIVLRGSFTILRLSRSGS